MVEHGGLTNNIQAKIRDFMLSEKSIILQNASQTFDISVWQFFTPLAAGSRSVICSNRVIMEPRSFIKQVINEHITIMEGVPSYLTVILDTLKELGFPSLPLEYLLITGEAVKPGLVRKWLIL
jgi:non-ribosomal peptide synthetase component F